MSSKMMKSTIVLLLVGLALLAMAGQNSALAFVAPTNTATATSDVGAAAEVTATATVTPTATTAAAAEEPTATSTTAATETAKPTATSTPVAPTHTAIATSVPPASTPTSTAKATATATSSAESSATVTPIAETATVTPTVASTATVTPTAKATVTATPTKTATATPTKAVARALSPRAPAYDSSQSTKVYAMNMGAGPADIAIQYYDSNGNPVTSDPSCTSVPTNGRCVFDGSSLTSPFSGSGVISSTDTVAAVARIIGSTYGTLADYVGEAQGGGDTSLFLPSVHRSVWQDQIAVQNMGSAAAQIDITVHNTTGAVVATDSISNVQPNATAYFNLATDAAFSGLGSSFAGSATLNGNGQPLDAIVLENNTQYGSKFAYQGFTTTDGGTTLYFPVLHRNRDSGYNATGWNSSTFIQNMDANNSVTVQVTWQDDVSTGGAIAKQANYNIPAGSSVYLTSYYEPSTRSTWAGSMTVAITSGTGPIVGISSEVYAIGSNISSYGEYRGVKQGATTLYSPIAEGHYNGTTNTGDYSRHFVQNLSSSQTANVTGEWINSSTGVTLYSLPVSIAPGASYYFAPNRQPSGSGLRNFSGTFKATSTNSVPIAALTYDSTPSGNVPGELNYPSDGTDMFNMPGQ